MRSAPPPRPRRTGPPGRRLALVAALASLLLTGTAGATAHTVPGAEHRALVSPAYAPTALVLTIGRAAPGTAAVPGTTAERAATLSCAPAPGDATGTHPDPDSACRTLEAAGGDFAALPSALAYTLCTREWAPVTAAASGVWHGERTEWSATYNNACELRATVGTVFSF
jgi:hypothetical protein